MPGAPAFDGDWTGAPPLLIQVGSEEVLLDGNELAKGHKFFSIGGTKVSDDGNRLAFTTDVTGFREYTLAVKDLRTGVIGPEKIAKVSSVAWASDNQTLIYVTDDAAKTAMEEPTFVNLMKTRAVELDYKNGEKARADLWHEYKAYGDILRRLGMIKK